MINLKLKTLGTEFKLHEPVTVIGLEPWTGYVRGIGTCDGGGGAGEETVVLVEPDPGTKVFRALGCTPVCVSTQCLEAR